MRRKYFLKCLQKTSIFVGTYRGRCFTAELSTIDAGEKNIMPNNLRRIKEHVNS